MTEPSPPSRLALVLLASVIAFLGVNFPLALVTLAVVLAVGGAGLAPRWPPAWLRRR